MKYRKAIEADLPLLAEMNHQLIEDEGHRNPMTLSQLKDRMAWWLKGEYEAALFEEAEEALAYALFRRGEGQIYLRHFFVGRSHRRKGVGKKAMGLLLSDVWPRGTRVVVEVLVTNGPGYRFWKSLGFEDYAISLERAPGNPRTGKAGLEK